MKDKKLPTTCSKDVHLVIHYNGVFALAALVSVVFLIAFSVTKGKLVESAVLVTLLATPLVTALNNLIGLVTQSRDQTPPPPAGTPADPVATTNVNKPNDPIPVVGPGQE